MCMTAIFRPVIADGDLWPKSRNKPILQQEKIRHVVIWNIFNVGNN